MELNLSVSLLCFLAQFSRGVLLGIQFATLSWYYFI